MITRFHPEHGGLRHNDHVVPSEPNVAEQHAADRLSRRNTRHGHTRSGFELRLGDLYKARCVCGQQIQRLTADSDDMGFANSAPIAHPALHRYSSSGFDEPYTDPGMAAIEGMPPEQVPESSTMDRDHKLLALSMPIYNFTLLDYSLRRVDLSMSAQLHGMFFLAESQWTSSPDAPPPPPELTCYRRNLFQVQGSIALPRSLRYIMTDQGDRIPILAQELTISATESVERNPVKIISVPWKTPAGNAPGAPEEKVEKEPPSIPLDAMGGQDMDVEYATFPIAWKRLQFRIATANNGRRKELQQHFVIKLKVVATLSTGTKISIAESHSQAIIVRGRSPRNFQSRKDYPLGNSASSRKNMHPQITRTSTGESSNPVQAQAPRQDVTPPEARQFQPEIDFAQSSPDFPDWQQLSQPGIGMNPLPTPTFSNPILQAPLPTYNQNNPEILSPSLPITHPSISAVNAPINLSFSDDESSPTPHPPPLKSHGPTSNPSPSFAKRPSHMISSSPTSAPQPLNPPAQRPRLNSHRTSSSKVIPLSINPAKQPAANPEVKLSEDSKNSNNPIPTLTPNESDAAVDTLYEYFPLGLDDLLPPVDAVYRPHVVHHTNNLASPGGAKTITSAGRVRSRRYFSEDLGVM